MFTRQKHILVRIPLLGTAILFVFRAKIAFEYFTGILSSLFSWLFKSREFTNFTYDLTPNNKRYLASLMANITNKSYGEIMGYISEIDKDVVLKQHIETITKNNSGRFAADSEARFGRRIGWYAFVRAIKPKIVVETGVDKGIGACVLTAALMKNKEEGYEGYYYGTDINPNAGYLLSGKYKEYGEVLYGDSIKSLMNLNKKIDLFINDSDHSPEYEAKEYEIILDKLSPQAIVLGDNSHATDKLLNFSIVIGRQFIFFQEKPYKHWYPGAGIGIAFKRTQ
ncbi:MAG: class I SAM-dependent methyltransferase [Nitrospirota bacterium]